MTPELNTVFIAILASVSAIVSPLLMAWLTNRNAARMKLADYARQDAVAARVADSARLLVESNHRQEEYAKEGAVTAAKAVETARAVVATQRIQVARLDQIHSLVNSNLTAAMQDQLDARSATLVLLKALADPAPEVIGQIEANKAKIDELTEQLAERKLQAKTAAEQLAVDLARKP